tara:strand:- start:1781 stop:2359 length:579 start_codon:yes stop_codon:yes gene_type:complete
MKQIIIFIIFISLPCGIFSSKIAGSKGWDKLNWFFIGLFFNFIGLFSAATIYDKKQRKYLSLIAEALGVKGKDIEKQIKLDTYNGFESLGSFTLPKSASKLEIIEKIIEIMGSDFAPNIDKNKIVLRKQPFSKYRQLILRNLKGSLILIAHAKEVSQNKYKWFLENPPSIPLPDILLIFKSRLTQFRRSGDY